MLTLFRWLLRLTVGLIVLAFAAVLLVWYFAVRSLPDYDADWTIAGLSAPVEIVRSSDAVPHVFGDTDADVYLGLGLAHAQDRLFQMIVLRRAAQGRLSELYGPRSYGADDLARRLGLAANAKASLAAQDPYTREALDAYAKGVNQWIEIINREARGRGAPEFFLYPDTIPYWQPEDSLAILKLVAAGWTRAIGDEVLRARLSLAAPGMGPDILAREGEPATPDYGTLFPSAGIAAASLKLPADPGNDAGPLGYIAPGGGAEGSGLATGATRTATGGPLLANTLDIPLTVPSLFYLARLQLESGGVIGATIPGMPAVLSGRSAGLAWGIAPAGIDDQDLFIEEVEPGNTDRYRDLAGWRDFDTRHEVIRVRGGDDQRITLRDTVNGPVLPAAHFDIARILPPGHVAALGWTGSSDHDTTMTALMGLMRAPERDSAIAATAGIVTPAMSITLADSDGIAQILAGARPARQADSQTSGLMPAPGWIAANRWQGTLPADASPRVIDPGGNAVATAGASLHTEDEPRLARLTGLLDSRDIHSRDSFIAIQLDTVSPVARGLLPLIGADLWFTGDPAPAGTRERQRQDALGLLAQWDGEMNEHLPEPAIYAVWMNELQDRLIRDELGPTADAVTRIHPNFIERVFRDVDGAAAWCDIAQSTEKETCATIARQALDAAIERLTLRFGPDVASWRWGNLHMARQQHPAFGRTTLLGLFANLRQSISGGDFTLALAASLGEKPTPWMTARGPGYRAVYDLADPDSSVFVTATGQSGNPLSRHYDDLSELWQRGEYIGMSLDPDLARAGAEGVTRLRPAPAPK